MKLFIKRLCDVIFSILGIVLLSPLLIIISIAVKIRVSGSVLFSQIRVGYNQKRFKIFKFRTIADGNEKRLKLIRRLKLDELPQLINILIGDMSFVGPRPYIEKESEDLPAERFTMRPGLTGLGQIYGNSELSWDERTAYDLDYIRNFSPWLDLKIMFRTVKVIVLGEKACLRHR